MRSPPTAFIIAAAAALALIVGAADDAGCAATCVQPRGTCVDGECFCFSGFSGPDCADPGCQAVNNCSGQGECVDSNVCECDDGFEGADCSTLTNPTCEDPTCNGRGACNLETLICDCEEGWAGVSCEFSPCISDDCAGHGECVWDRELEQGLCECELGYDPESDCYSCADGYTEDWSEDDPRCVPIVLCGSTCVEPRGVCNRATGECTCNSGFSGDNCENLGCQSVNNCSGQGECVDSNVCECDDGFEGDDCSDPVNDDDDVGSGSSSDDDDDCSSDDDDSSSDDDDSSSDDDDSSSDDDDSSSDDDDDVAGPLSSTSTVAPLFVMSLLGVILA